ncbi:MAG: UbiH/UbiF/VisC/COQ6 family ubiquinone biosynthesis hydroxylase [Maricaulaceae bacterium]|jgi:2-octaprenyl-6-methoxyphenol hydroxylase
MTEPSRDDFDAIFAGGGLVGLAAALAAARVGLNVLVIDAAPAETQLAASFDGRASAIAYANFRMLSRLGVAERIGAHAQRIEQILVSDGRAGDDLRAGGPGPRLLHFDARELDDAENGEPLGYMVENRRMRAALIAAAAEAPRLTHLAPARVTEVRLERQRAVVRLEDGTEHAAPLVVGAEGRFSAVRDAMGARIVGWPYRQHGIVATVACEKPHEGVAHEYFLPSGPFAILPLTDNRASLVWTERPDAAAAAMKLDDEAFADEIRRRFGAFLGEVNVEGPRFSYPLGVAVSDKFVAPRAALVGDAARRIHPIAGQGFNLGLKDAAALADVLKEALTAGLDLGGLDVLRRYQEWRRFDSVVLALATDGFNRLYSNDMPLVRFARGLGMAAVDKIGLARRLFTRNAGADMGELPSLLRPL